ncbi:uncharacterized protein EDB91DRAFT_484850 [Suillus paluster]|uniref:uncharacterized protein n=1 Tax=Suillus paluster TaxID=48578 RepID=UPI001B86A485|nr:uncharacterized protein EDB91DRAFT_484850 [Suillus paluster]KAG1737582.1 hypothetical protein EDB91DRAFT_484850 [Suillus paluster]
MRSSSMLTDHISSPILEQFDKNSQRHLLACDLENRGRRMMECFANSTGTLPMPSTTTRNVWNLLPNDTANTMAVPLRAGVVFLRAPPPTPMDAAFTVVNESSSRTRSDDMGWSLIYETRLPTPDTLVSEVASDTCGTDIVSSTDFSEGCQPKADEQSSLEIKDSDKNVLSPSDHDHLCPSDAEGSSFTQPGGSPILAGGFEEIVDVRLEELRVRGLGFIVESLLAAGVESVQSAPLISMVVRTMSHRMTKKSPTEAKRFEKALRERALEVFRQYWKPDGDWRHISSTSGRHSALTLIGVNKAGLMGSLFSAKVVTGGDIALCLSMLEEEVHFDRLCAMHALLLYANDKLCKTRNLPALTQLKARLSHVDPVTGLYLWAPAPHARTLLQDISDIIEGWMVVQADKRKRYHPSDSSPRPPLKAVGPRMREGRTRDKA